MIRRKWPRVDSIYIYIHLHTHTRIYIYTHRHVYTVICWVMLTWGAVGMLAFLQPRSFDLAQDVDATCSFGLAHDVDAKDVDATLTWGGVGWPGSACKSPRPTLYVAAADDDEGSGDDVDDDDDDPVELFQTRGKWWELIVILHHLSFLGSFKLEIKVVFLFYVFHCRLHLFITLSFVCTANMDFHADFHWDFSCGFMACILFISNVRFAPQPKWQTTTCQEATWKSKWKSILAMKQK